MLGGKKYMGFCVRSKSQEDSFFFGPRESTIQGVYIVQEWKQTSRSSVVIKCDEFYDRGGLITMWKHQIEVSVVVGHRRLSRGGNGWTDCGKTHRVQQNEKEERHSKQTLTYVNGPLEEWNMEVVGVAWCGWRRQHEGLGSGTGSRICGWGMRQEKLTLRVNWDMKLSHEIMRNHWRIDY